MGASTEHTITQTIKGDQNGVFAYAAPETAWWGVAALDTADEKTKQDGREKDVYPGAVFRVKFLDWKER